MALKVRLGEYIINTNTEPYTPVEIPVSSIKIHEQYNFANLVADIAVLKLASSVDVNSNPHIVPICLPTAGTLFTGQR